MRWRTAVRSERGRNAKLWLGGVRRKPQNLATAPWGSSWTLAAGSRSPTLLWRYADLPAGLQFSVISHFWSPLSASLVVPNTNVGPGEFRSDFTGDRTTQDPLPGTHNGSVDRGINASNIKSVITKYNSIYANQPNAAGQVLINKWTVHVEAVAGAW